MVTQSEAIKIYVEGGGGHEAELRRGFQKFIANAGLRGKIRVVACGSRGEAYNDYCKAIKLGERALLLVDSEEPVAEEALGKPWQHLSLSGERWPKPKKAEDADCHLMVQVMEAWFLADGQALANYFGAGFNAKAFSSSSIEDVMKEDVLQKLDSASKGCKKGPYSKGRHSFDLLGEICPQQVMEKSKWARRFLDEVKVRTEKL